MIPFNIPVVIGKETDSLAELMEKHRFCGDGVFTRRCSEWLEKRTGTKKALLTSSCTHALEMAALLFDIRPGDEVIMPSFTFVSTANAFVLRGAKVVFIDIRPDTMNMNETLIEQAITSRTRAVVPVHYGGVGCEMDSIMQTAKKHNLAVIEDAAQGMMCAYKGNPLGSIGAIGTFSFHESKNYHCGEGGAILLNDQSLIERAEIIREKGTNRSKFYRGQVDKYTWVDIGSSYLPSELSAAFLRAQLEAADEINTKRLSIWNIYREQLSDLAKAGYFELTDIPSYCKHNAHLFYIKMKDLEERHRMIEHLKNSDIYATFHYIPLHTSKAGRIFGEFRGEDKYTTKDSERLLRLPLYYDLKPAQADFVCEKVREYFKT